MAIYRKGNCKYFTIWLQIGKLKVPEDMAIERETASTLRMTTDGETESTGRYCYRKGNCKYINIWLQMGKLKVPEDMAIERETASILRYGYRWGN